MAERNIKPFKTVDELLGILESRGLIIDDRNEATGFLLRNNYYAVVNGYKEFFLDPNRCNETVEVYRQGTHFRHLMSLYSFDRLLRFSMMGRLATAEAALKTATVHAFCDRNRGAEDYLDPSLYCSESQYRHKNYERNLKKLLTILKDAKDGKGERRPYIEHYRIEYGEVPLWVLANALTFGNMSHFYGLQKTGVQNKACKVIWTTNGGRRIEPKRMEGIYSNLASFRNICAHGGRLFCARTGARGDKDFKDMLVDLCMVSTPDERQDCIRTVERLTRELDRIRGMEGITRREMGFEGVDLNSLL